MAWFPRIEAVGLISRKVVLEHGIILPIFHVYDADGDETDDPEEAMTVVAGSDEFGWITITLSDGDFPTVH